MKYTIHETLYAVSQAKTHKERVEVLQKAGDVVVKQVLKYNFDPAIVFDLPEGAPPYKADRSIPIGMGEATFHSEARRLYIFLKEKQLPKGRKESLFIQMLEGLHYTDAECLIALKDKALSKKYKGLTEKVVRDAFPDLLPPAEVKKKASPLELSGE